MTRVIPPCVLTGEACGIIASIIVDKKINIKEIDIKEVQNKMVERGNILHHFYFYTDFIIMFNIS